MTHRLRWPGVTGNQGRTGKEGDRITDGDVYGQGDRTTAGASVETVHPCTGPSKPSQLGLIFRAELAEYTRSCEDLVIQRDRAAGRVAFIR